MHGRPGVQKAASRMCKVSPWVCAHHLGQSEKEKKITVEGNGRGQERNGSWSHPYCEPRINSLACNLGEGQVSNVASPRLLPQEVMWQRCSTSEQAWASETLPWGHNINSREFLQTEASIQVFFTRPRVGVTAQPFTRSKQMVREMWMLEAVAWGRR